MQQIPNFYVVYTGNAFYRGEGGELLAAAQLRSFGTFEWDNPVLVDGSAIEGAADRLVIDRICALLEADPPPGVPR